MTEMLAKYPTSKVRILLFGVIPLISITIMGIISITNYSQAVSLSVYEQTSLGTIEQRSSTDIVSSANSTLTVQSASPPSIIERLCTHQDEQDFVTSNGQQHIFHKNAASVQRCNDGTVWKASENGAMVNDAATFYFDENGVLLDICQALFWQSGCTRFQDISCEQLNYCKN